MAKAKYVVTCQNAAGTKRDLPVRAATDEAACDSALRELNSWRVLRVVPAPDEKER